MIELSKYVFEMLKLQNCQLLGRNLLQARLIEAQVRRICLALLGG